MINSKYFTIILISMLILSSANYVNGEQNTPTLPSNIIYVSPDGNDTQNGLTPETSKKTICNAVESAQHNDTIQIAPGTYIENTIFIRKKLTLRGTDPKNTIIQGKGSKCRSCISVEANGDALIQKFTITPSKTKKDSRGIINNGGVVIVEDSIITGHTNISGGGGIATNFGFVTVRNCQIIGNTAVYGGGIYNYKGTLLVEDSIIKSNNCGRTGGGLLLYGDTTIKRSVITMNNADGYITGYGGGILSSHYNIVVQDSMITCNNANYGGGIFYYKSKVNLNNCIVSNNIASQRGGGIYLYYKGSLTLNNSTITTNSPNNFDKGEGWFRWIYD